MWSTSPPVQFIPREKTSIPQSRSESFRNEKNSSHSANRVMVPPMSRAQPSRCTDYVSRLIILGTVHESRKMCVAECPVINFTRNGRLNLGQIFFRFFTKCSCVMKSGQQMTEQVKLRTKRNEVQFYLNAQTIPTQQNISF